MTEDSGKPARTDQGAGPEVTPDPPSRVSDARGAGRRQLVAPLQTLRRSRRTSLNHLADQAGRHRRLAGGIGLLGFPLTCMAAVLIGSDDLFVFALSHLGLAGTCLWVALDLVSSGSMIDRHGIPNVSSGALMLAAATQQVVMPASFAADFGPRWFVIAGLVLLGLALAVLIVADAKESLSLALIGRLVLVSGGPVLGFANLGAGLIGFPDHVIYSLSLGLIGVLLLAMAAFEARLLWRGIELAVDSRV